MFNTSVSCKPQITHNNSIDISAVSGTFVKSHPKSFIVAAQFGSDVAKKLTGSEPTYQITEHKQREIRRYGNILSNHTTEWYDEYIDKPVVILQAMCAHSEYMMYELMWKEDFEEVMNQIQLSELPSTE